MLTDERIRSGLAGFDSAYPEVMGEAALFARRRRAETPAWHWAWDALIHWRRGHYRLAQVSWRHAVRLTLNSRPQNAVSTNAGAA